MSFNFSKNLSRLLLRSVPLVLAAQALVHSPRAHALDVGQAAPCVVLDQVLPDNSEENRCIRDTLKPEQRFTLIEFSSISCGACQMNLPVIHSLSENIAATTQTRIVYIDTNEALVRRYITQNRAALNVPVALDTNRDAKRAYDINATPTLFLLDSAMNVVYKHVGTLSSEDVTHIQELVR